ncbi:MAG TPA: hypothetical protein VM492_09020 [Sumerlaeia bacterium]|nr:hypothetical protein [Sumerlaeia bacterium]
MNSETGEIRTGPQLAALLERNAGKAPPPWIEFKYGELVEIRGCYFVIDRMTRASLVLTPISREAAEKIREEADAKSQATA